jgi:hypothetical protein
MPSGLQIAAYQMATKCTAHRPGRNKREAPADCRGLAEEPNAATGYGVWKLIVLSLTVKFTV